MNPGRNLRARLLQLGKELPQPQAPASAAYAPWVLSGNHLHLAGQVSIQPHAAYRGRLGDSMELAEGRMAAECCALGLLARLDIALEGDMDGMVRLVRLGVFVACTADFDRHGAVADAASELMLDVFGARAVHARTSIGVLSLPRGAAVEIDAVFEVKT